MQKKNNIKVLIIDDNLSILQYLKTVFERYQFEVKTSTNGYEGLQDAAEFRPDIIFLDLMMPNIDGIKMLNLKKVLSDIKDIPVIVISANAGRNNVLAAMEAGADRVLAKPINVKLLRAAVNELIGGDNFKVTNGFNNKQSQIIEENSENILEIYQKFDEYLDTFLTAVNNRDSSSIKKISSMLNEYCTSNCSSEISFMLKEIEGRDFTKPSDWMFVEMKIKQIEQKLKKKITN